jgi:hypothetical protein
LKKGKQYGIKFIITLRSCMFKKNHDGVHCALQNKHEDGHMQNFKHKKYLGGMLGSKCLKPLFIGAKLSCMLQRKECTLNLCCFHTICVAQHEILF